LLPADDAGLQIFDDCGDPILLQGAFIGFKHAARTGIAVGRYKPDGSFLRGHQIAFCSG
jgi:hypothetical protein